jgi:malonyl-CoA decarboxylase
MMRRRRWAWAEQVALVAERGRAILGRRSVARRTDEVIELSKRLIAQRGEASGLALASEIVAAIGQMDESQIASLLDSIARGFAPDAARLERAIDAWQTRRDQQTLVGLAAAAEPPRQELFRRINMVPGGTMALVQLRARLLGLPPTHDGLMAVDADMRHLFGSWFNRGFLQLEQISWNSSAAILERLIQYEAVHEIRGWEDLRLRLAPDRRCYAFFHPSLPGEPLIFVEVALTRGLPAAIVPLIDPGRKPADPAGADTAVFYSISNCQRGLRGISFGNFLIKQVAAQLSDELPRLKTFATLSPVPGFAAALAERGEPGGFTDARVRMLVGDEIGELCRLAGEEDPSLALRRLLSGDPPWPIAVQRALGRLVVAYLTRVRRGTRVADPVAHFHLANGARLERINIDADPTELGRQSHGVMVNYLYDLDALELNHERYVESGQVAMAPSVASTARRVDSAWSANQGAGSTVAASPRGPHPRRQPSRLGGPRPPRS